MVREKSKSLDIPLKLFLLKSYYLKYASNFTTINNLLAKLFRSVTLLKFFAIPGRHVFNVIKTVFTFRLYNFKYNFKYLLSIHHQ